MNNTCRENSVAAALPAEEILSPNPNLCFTAESFNHWSNILTNSESQTYRERNESGFARIFEKMIMYFANYLGRIRTLRFVFNGHRKGKKF